MRWKIRKAKVIFSTHYLI